jgi:hypothetical protein
MNPFKSPHQLLLEEAGASLDPSPGLVNTPQQMLMQQANVLPHFAPGGHVQNLSPADMQAALIVNGHTPQNFAAGGQPEFGEARAYENSPSEAVHDWAAKHIGHRTADRLFGGPRADATDRLFLQSLNPINYATGIADSAKGFYESAKENDYPGAAMHYGMGLLNALPFLGKGKSIAQRVISPMSIKENLPNFGLSAVSELAPIKTHK